MKTLLFILLVTLASCATQERCTAKYPPQIKEITNTVTIYRDTTIFVYIKPDTVHDVKTVYVDKGGLIQSDPSFLNTRFARSKAYVLNSKLFHELTQLDDSIQAVIHNATKTEIQYIEKTTTVEVERSLTGWQYAQIWAGRLLMLSVLVLILVYVARIFIKI